MMDNSIQIPLDLPDVRVLEVSKTEEGTWLIRVESTLNGTSCRKCGKKLTHFHLLCPADQTAPPTSIRATSLCRIKTEALSMSEL